MEVPIAEFSLPDYPIFACALGTATENGRTDYSAVCAGGQGDKSFIGNPVYCISPLITS